MKSQSIDSSVFHRRGQNRILCFLVFLTPKHRDRESFHDCTVIFLVGFSVSPKFGADLFSVQILTALISKMLGNQKINSLTPPTISTKIEIFVFKIFTRPCEMIFTDSVRYDKKCW